MDETFYPTPTIAIPVPRHSIQPRGVNSLKVASPQRSIRFADEEYNTIQEAATIMKMGKADFVRWCALAAANELIRQHTLFERGQPVATPPVPMVKPIVPVQRNTKRDTPGPKPAKKLSDMISFGQSRKEVI